MPDDLITYAEAAAILGANEQRVRHLVAYRRLTSYKVKGYKNKFLSKADVEQVRRGTPPPVPAPIYSPPAEAPTNNMPPALRDLLVMLLSAAATFYLDLKRKGAEQEKALIDGYNASLERITSIAHQGTPTLAPDWMQQFMGTPNPSREQTLAMAEHAPEIMRMVFGGAEIPPEEQARFEPILKEGLSAVYEGVQRLQQEEHAREREKVPA